MNDDPICEVESEDSKDPVTMLRRVFLKSAAGTAAVWMFPINVFAGDKPPREQVIDQLRQHLRGKKKFKTARINRIVKRAERLLPNLGRLSHGHVVIGVRLGADGDPLGISECSGGHSCAGRFDKTPTNPECTSQGTVCNAEACKEQACDNHWCNKNSCAAEACDNHLCEEQSCETEACDEHTCEDHEDEKVTAIMSKSAGWKRIQADIVSLKSAKKLKVTVAVQPSAPAK
ncbi:MAG: hypothetical protein ACYS22_11295 [Planctomycetota bacterium]|jgi:hypothetical protein